MQQLRPNWTAQILQLIAPQRTSEMLHFYNRDALEKWVTVMLAEAEKNAEKKVEKTGMNSSPESYHGEILQCSQLFTNSIALL